MNNQEMMIVVAIIALALIGVGLWVYLRSRRSAQLRQQFGPEYERAMHEVGDRNKAEAELQARAERVSHLRIVALSPEDASYFREQWRLVQSRFVDDPRSAVNEADQLVAQLMQKRGYPMGDFEQCAADISVDHPMVVEHYRAAHDIALQNQRGHADTEGLRRALVHFRALFDELLEVKAPEPQPAGMHP
jgi:hypothetical protein